MLYESMISEACTGRTIFSERVFQSSSPIDLYCFELVAIVKLSTMCRFQDRAAIAEVGRVGGERW